MNNKSQARQKIRYRIRKKVNGTSSIPRLSVYRSNSDIYAQLIDDTTGVTIAGASSRQKDIAAQKAPKVDKSKMVGEAIARNLFEMTNLKVPVICIIIGEGASGGALGIGVGDKVLMLENTWYSVISPESCSSILWRSWNFNGPCWFTCVCCLFG